MAKEKLKKLLVSLDKVLGMDEYSLDSKLNNLKTEIVKNVELVKSGSAVKVSFPSEIDLKKPKWFDLSQISLLLMSVSNSLKKVFDKIPEIKFPTKAKNAIPVRLSDGEKFYDAINQQTEKIIGGFHGGGSGVPTIKSTTDGVYGVPIVNPDGSSIGTNETTSQGNIADHAADSGNPVKVGGKYNANAPTYTDGDRTDLQSDINGNLKVVFASALAGEDLVNDLQKVEQRYSYSYVVADTLVKTGAGFIHTVTFTPLDAAATAGTIFLYDSVTEAVPTIFSYYIPAAALVPVTIILDVSFATGLYVGFTTTTDVACTISYR